MVSVLADEAADALQLCFLLGRDALQQLLLALLQDPVEGIKAQPQVLLLPSAVLLWDGSRGCTLSPSAQLQGWTLPAPPHPSTGSAPGPDPPVPTSMVWQISSICVMMAWIRSFPATSMAMPSLSSLWEYRGWA